MATPPTALALRLSGEDHALEPGRDYLLGSATDCDIRLPAPTAAHHARLSATADAIELADLGTALGTWRNGERIGHAVLATGDALRFGDTEALVVPDHGTATIVPLPAMRAAATTRRLRAIGARAAEVLRQRTAPSFDELMADELRRAPWFAGSLALHALLFLVLWLLLPDAAIGGRQAAKVGITPAASAQPGDAAPPAPDVIPEPPVDAFTAPAEPLETPAATIVTDPAVEPVVPTSNPRVVLSAGASPPGSASGRDPIGDQVRTVGSGGFKKTVAELQKTGLEIVFVFDSTGSMHETIVDTKATVAQMLAVLRALVPDARIGIVTYRDRGREVYRVRELPLGVDFFRTSNFVQCVAAEGGGDRPEDVRAGLQSAFAQRWRPNARRVVVLAGDAPPHDNEVKGLLSDVRRFATDGRSFVHTLVTSPASAGPDTRECFAEIAKAGKGTCADIGSRERVLQRVLSLAFGREFDQDLAAVIRAVDDAQARVDTASLDLARRGGGDLARELQRNPVPMAIVNALVRRPRRDTALGLVELLHDPATPEHTLQAVAWILQRTLELPSPPVDPLGADRPTANELERLRRRCLELPD